MSNVQIKLALRVDEIQAVVDYRAALRASIAAGLAYASSRNATEIQQRERARDEASAKCHDARRTLDLVLRGDE